MIIDNFGMIISNGDGGDSCHRMFSVMLTMLLVGENTNSGEFDLETYDKLRKASESLSLPEGIYVRHPDPDQWYSDPRNFSRDQMTPAICFLALLSYHNKPYRDSSLSPLLKACLKRGMFAQNIYPNWLEPKYYGPSVKKTPDLLGPELWATFARGYVKSFWAPIAIPIVVFGDIFLILSVLSHMFLPRNVDGTLKFRMPKPDDVDDMNINNVIVLAQNVFPTPFSFIARKIYKWFRPKNMGNIELGEPNRIMGALRWYHRNGNQDIAELYRPLVERY